MFNLNEKYFSISERCGRNHQNKFCLRPLKGRFYPWELNSKNLDSSRTIFIIIFFNFEKKMLMENSFARQINKDATHIITQIEYGSDIYIEIIYTGTSLP